MNDREYILKLKPRSYQRLCRITAGITNYYEDINGLHTRVMEATWDNKDVKLLLTRTDCLVIHSIATRIMAQLKDRSSIDFGLSELRRDLWSNYNAACKEIRDNT